MGKEIERKFLVTRIPNLLIPVSVKQGYVLNDELKHLRVRIMDGKGYLTLKFTKHFVRDEYEYEIPLEDAEEIYEQCCIIVEKRRYQLDWYDCHIDIDDYGNGLVVGEIELPSENHEFPMPDFFAEEITGKKCYSNLEIAKENYLKRWKMI